MQWMVQLGGLILLASQLCQAEQLPEADWNNALHLPPGFKISVFADHLPAARSLALGEHGEVYVGTANDKVFAVVDKDGDGFAEQHYLIAENLNQPNGLAYQDHALFVGEIHRIIRFDGINRTFPLMPKPHVVYDQLPTDPHHGAKYLSFGPDGKLYSAIGAPCNSCEIAGTPFGSLVRMNPDGSDFEYLATGIRNSVGFDWHPQTGRLFFNDNGRDYLGDDAPADELNQWHQRGDDFGFPYCHAGLIADPEIKSDKTCAESIAPVWQYKAHIAPLGMRFYTGNIFPQEYQQQLFVAQHGSWNRRQPQGYQIALVKFKQGKPYQEQTFISGWLKGSGEVIGRPVDLLFRPDGSLLISDDKQGLIYKVEYQP